MYIITGRAGRFFLTSSIVCFISLLLLLSGCHKEEAPVTPKNHKPVITSVISEKDTLLINSRTRLKCTASDIDNDSLVFTWSSGRGSFTGGNKGSEVNWTAPSSEGKDTICVSVNDGKESVQRKIEILTGNVPPVPVLLKPVEAEQEIELTTKLIWKAAKGAKFYDLQVSTEEKFLMPVLNRKNKVSTSAKLKGLIPNTVYYWRVRSKNEFGNSKWSKTFYFKTVSAPAAPRLISPNDSAANVPISQNLTWKSLKNADGYKLQVSEDKTFNTFLIDTVVIKDTAMHVSRLIHFAAYYWRVSAVNSYGTSGWSETRQFFTTGTAPQPPSLRFPDNGSKDISHSLTFVWEDEKHASGYSLQVSADSTFSSYMCDLSGLSKTSYKTDIPGNTKTYYWRVKSENNYGSSAWSAARKFTTLLPAPELTSPVNGASDVSPSPVISWVNVAEAETYSLQIAADSLFKNIVYDGKEITENTVLVKGLSSFTKYFWRVSAVNSFSISEWTKIREFTVSSYFYKNLPYGIQATYNPVNVILNGGYDMVQVGNKRKIKDFPYNIASKNIWRNLSSPFSVITRYGWWDFISDQVLPLSLDKKNGQFWPNYTLHLIGGGMEYAAMKEWYEYYHYPSPPVLSALTIMSYHLLNEIVENGNHIGDDVDPIADIYLFDIGGIILFSSESVKRFFSEDLNLADWSQQSSFSLRNGELHNNGQFFSVKWKFPFFKSWYAFYYFGTNGVGGLSYKFDDGTALSVGAGLAASDLVLLDETTNKKTLGLVGNLGVFIDKNNSLLASLSVTIKTDYMVNVNIYPGIVKLWSISPGLWGAYSQDGNMIFGFTLAWLPFGFAQSLK